MTIEARRSERRAVYLSTGATNVASGEVINGSGFIPSYATLNFNGTSNFRSFKAVCDVDRASRHRRDV
jgi:hypothetical protein